VKFLVWLALFYSIQVHAETLSKSENLELALILSTSEVVFKSNTFPNVLVIETWEEISECGGLFESCPNARLFVIVSNGDLYEVPALYELPKSKGWKFIDFVEKDNFYLLSVSTTLEHANVSPESRKAWKSKVYTVKISKYDDGAVSLVE